MEQKLAYNRRHFVRARLENPEWAYFLEPILRKLRDRLEDAKDAQGGIERASERYFLLAGDDPSQ